MPSYKLTCSINQKNIQRVLAEIMPYVTELSLNADKTDSSPQRTDGDIRPNKNVVRDPTKSRASRTLMDHFTPSGEFRSSDANVWLEKEGYAKGTTSSTLTSLTRAGFVETLSRGKFRFVKPLNKIEENPHAPQIR